MKLKRLVIRSLPGIDGRFTVDIPGAGLNVIIGPNGIGKSSLCRAMAALLWKDGAQGAHVTASACFELEGGEWTVERDGGSWRWYRDGSECPPPRLPAEHLSDNFFLGLRELLDAKRDAGNDVAQAIREQMSGGYDLTAVAEAFATAPLVRKGKSARQACDKAERAVGEAQGRQKGLHDREAMLAQLEQEKDEAEGAVRTLGHVRSALDLHAWREELEQLETQLAALPGALERLSGKEGEELEELERQLVAKGADRTKTAQGIEDERTEAGRTRLTVPLDDALLATAGKRAEALKDKERERDQAQTEWKGEGRAVAEASRAVGGYAESPSEFDLGESADLFAFLRDAQAAETELGALDERLQLLDPSSFSEEAAQQLEQLRRGVDQLRAWLRSPPVGAAPEHETPGPARLLEKLAAALLAVGLGLGFAVERTFFAVAGVGLGLFIAVRLMRARRGPETPTVDARGHARSEFPQGLEPPTEWTNEAVTARSRELDEEFADLLVTTERERDRNRDRESLQNRREILVADMAQLEDRRAQLVQALHLEAIRPDVELVDTAVALNQLRAAREREARAAAGVQSLEKQCAALIAELAEVLTCHGEAAPVDASSARAGVESLERRNRTLRDTRKGQALLERHLEQCDADLERIEKAANAIYKLAELEVGDRGGLSSLLSNLDRYRELRPKRDALSNEIDRTEKHLDEAGQAALGELDSDSLQERLREIDKHDAELEKMHSEIADIRSEVRTARAGHVLEEALAARDEQLEQLRVRRELAMHAAAGQFLIERVRNEHDTDQMPRVLERARELFGTFTNHAYELEVAREDGTSFRALETSSGERRWLNELSDGTRVQLALAARLAFVEDAEQGEPLPLFLDEALDHSDSERFQAIARSLARMAQDDGRQIFYLTSDEHDAERLQLALREEGCERAPVIDLAAVRGREWAVRDRDALTVRPLPTVPEPGGMTAEAYGAALSIPRFDPRRGHLDQHLYYLLSDDLRLLRRLLQNRIESVGQWLALARSSAPLAEKIAVCPGAGEQLDARTRLLEVYCQVWAEGRGRPVGREAIEASKAITDNYLEVVVQIASAEQGDGERLLVVLLERDYPGLKGFRDKSRESLARYLAEEGYTDEQPILEAPEVELRMRAAPAAGELPEELTTRLVHTWCRLSPAQPLDDRDTS
ncbi:MAG: hypothetical protein E2O39_05020 [Planctomycetota bacterium]|nr:MAG: hypothetical protein E2O39_05020 [Planctomycetota bacterium]